jgi:spore cortex biosynthesis protein YabQ
VSEELMLFSRFFLVGAVIAISYDCLRVIRRIFLHGILWISLEDIIFAVLAGSVFFLELCDKNDGILRGYIFLAVFSGTAAGELLAGRYFVRFFSKVISFIKNRLKKWLGAATIKDKRCKKETWRKRSDGETEKKAS